MTDADPRAAAHAKFDEAPPWPGLALLARCATDPPLGIATLLDAVRPIAAPGSTICELGFGDGWLLDEMSRAFPDARLAGLDQSRAYVQRARERFGARVSVLSGDIEALPFAEKSLDALVTCWTMYFIADIDAALAGMRRCVRRRGRVVAATVAPDHMIEHEQMLAEAMRTALGRDPEPDIGLRFDLSSGEPYMRRAFEDVELRRWQGTLTLPDVSTAMELFAAYPPAGVSDEEKRVTGEAYRSIAEARLASNGPIRVRRHDGAFVATA